ncbi:nop2/Sun-like domain containing protein 5 [Dermacentor variabilis]|uniref:nop2/Sun-like domain containing protein 5 n=1 Tax=Dermacentor variabilis TaxID=34621 RepID=UPI003F5B4022
MPRAWKGITRTPRRYKEAARIVDALNTSSESLESLVTSSRMPNKTQLAALVIQVSKKLPVLEAVVSQSPLLDEGLPKALALVLVHEALFGVRPLYPGICARADQVLACRPQLEKALADVSRKGKVLPASLPRYARVNTLLLHTSTVIRHLEQQGFRWVRYPRRRGLPWFLERVRRLEPHEFLKDFHLRDWLVFGTGAKLNSLDLVENLQLLLQDKASGMAVIALDPQPGAVLLDACAAPGMKTSYAAALMNNTGRILAVDRSGERVEAMQQLVKNGGFKSICWVQETDFLEIDPHTEPQSSAEFIMVDPSCSGTGLCDRPGPDLDPESAEGKERLRRLSSVQSMLLKHALRFPHCRRVVYSTCSVLRQENEDVVAEALAWAKERFVLAHALPELPFRGLGSQGSHCVRLGPDNLLTRGFFLAVFEKATQC